MEKVIGPDNLDMGENNLRRKFRWVVKLFKDAKQVNKAEFVRVSRRPPLNINATVEKSWNSGGVMEITFFRTNVEPFDEVWIGLHQGDGSLVEEWELCDVKRLPLCLFTSHIPGDEEYEDNEGEETAKIDFRHMRYRRHVKLGFGIDDKVGKWENWSVI